MSTTEITFCCGKKCRKNGSSDLIKFSKAYANKKGISVSIKACKCLDECKKGPIIFTKGNSDFIYKVDKDKIKRLIKNI